jgi:transposase
VGQITRLAWRHPVVDGSGDTRRRGKLAKAGSPHLRWALVEVAVHASRDGAPNVEPYRAVGERRDATVARLTVARKIGKRAYHVLRERELAAA